MKRYELANGMRVLTQSRTGARAANVAVFVGAGSRYEAADERGLSHFIEHMVFKGTHRRGCAAIADETDLIGGQLNAYTAKEYTCFYIRTLPELTGEGVDILGDIVTDPLFAPAEMELERGVILEEIAMYDDDPEDLAGDRIYRAAWGANPLGESITGTAESVSAATPEKLRAFYERFYRPDNMVIAVSGKFDEEKTRADLEKAFGGLARGSFARPTAAAPVFSPEKLEIHRGGQQLQFCLAWPCAGLDSRRGAELSLLNGVAGGGASSLLFRRLRDELGLAYSVYSYFTAHVGGGVFVVAGGISPAARKKTLAETEGCLARLRAGISQEQLLRARNQALAGLAMSGENSYNSVDIGRRELLGLPQRTERANRARIEAVTAEKVTETAREIFSCEPASCFVGKLR